MNTGIIGHEHQRQLLAQAIQRGRIAGAYLFAGPEGIGKYMTAMEFARAMNCQSGSGSACGHCQSCAALDDPRIGHPDTVRMRDVAAPLGFVRETLLRAVYTAQLAKARSDYLKHLAELEGLGLLRSVPLAGRGPSPIDFVNFNPVKMLGSDGMIAQPQLQQLFERAGKPATPMRRCAEWIAALAGPHAYSETIRIDAIRQHIQQSISFPPFSGKRKVFIIDQADQMNIEAANALLKTLEEPPSHATIILVTDKPRDLLPTIRSRCQIVMFGQLSEPQLTALLERSADYSQEEREQIIRVCGGQPAKALRTDWTAFFHMANALSRSILALDLEQVDQLLLAADLIAPDSATAADGRIETLNRLDLIDVIVRDLAARVGAGADHCILTPVRELQDPLPWDLVQIDAIRELTVQARRRIYGNADPQLAAEALVIQWAALPRRDRE